MEIRCVIKWHTATGRAKIIEGTTAHVELKPEDVITSIECTHSYTGKL